MAKKVGTLKKEEEVEKVKGRQEYDVAALKAENKDAVDANGLITVAPKGFDPRKNIPMKKEQFSSEAVYIRYQAVVAESRAEFFSKKTVELNGKADRLEKFGSEDARRTASKLVRAKAQMATLREQLLATGMGEEELDELIANM